MRSNWEYSLEPFGQTSAGKDFENKFEIRGELGWEYAGMTKDSDGADFYVWPGRALAR
jgi:hypothetical protein